MSENPLWRGAVVLPWPVMVAEDALGARFDLTFKAGSMSVWMPALPKEGRESHFELVSPLPDMEEVDRKVKGSNGIGWGDSAFPAKNGRKRILASNAHAVAVEMDHQLSKSTKVPNGSPALGRVFDVWWQDVLAWLEVWSPQELIPDANTPLRSRGWVLDPGSPPARLTGWGFGGVYFVLAEEHAVTRAMLNAAMTWASQGSAPPLPWRLLCRARRVLDPRQAVMDGAAAAEIALAETVHSRLVGIDGDAREQIVKNANGVVGLVQLVEELDSLPASLSRRRRIADRLAGPRNDAAHRGIRPSPEETRRALSEVTDLLQAYCPAPKPT